LPFSDPGTQLGALVAKNLNLPGPDLERVHAALDKFAFRQLEAAAPDTPASYKKIKSVKVSSLDEIQNLYQELNGKIFIKPTKEGNSRGCMDVKSAADCEIAWEQVGKYKSHGLVVEELIQDGVEYSWDHVAGHSWVTEKQTTNTNYRAEIQQIVPASLGHEIMCQIESAGKFIADLSGSQGGACHNEIFYLSKSGEVSAVEPNLRPAGMRIWDLAAIAFEDFDPWKSWILWAVGRDNSENNSLTQSCYAGIRMITANVEGEIKSIPTDLPKEIISKNKNSEVLELVWSKRPGDKVTTDVKDNSDFIGYVIGKAEKYDDLIELLNTSVYHLSGQVEIC